MLKLNQARPLTLARISAKQAMAPQSLRQRFDLVIAKRYGDSRRRPNLTGRAGLCVANRPHRQSTGNCSRSQALARCWMLNTGQLDKHVACDEVF